MLVKLRTAALRPVDEASGLYGSASVGGMLNTSRSPNAEMRSSGGIWARCAINISALQCILDELVRLQ